MDSKDLSRNSSLISKESLLNFFHKRIKAEHYVSVKYLRIEKLPDSLGENSAIPEIPWLSEANDNYFEVPLRCGGLMPVISMIGFFAFSGIAFLFIFMLVKGAFWDSELFILDLILIFITFYALPLSARYVWFTPHLLPIRFNRKTQRVYFYQREVKFNPFVRWTVVVNIMEWKNIQAWMLVEKTYRSAGYWAIHCIELTERKDGIKRESPLFIVPPVGTNLSINTRLEKIWSYCLYYMNGVNVSRKALYNKKPWFLANTRLIKWPDDIDKESRSNKDT